jgi:hypothetical protein
LGEAPLIIDLGACTRRCRRDRSRIFRKYGAQSFGLWHQPGVDRVVAEKRSARIRTQWVLMTSGTTGMRASQSLMAWTRLNLAH